MIFTGNFDYYPNVDAFFYFAEEIFPRIRARVPNAEFLAVGWNPQADMLKKAQELGGVTIAGSVPDMRPYYAKARIAVVPLRIGSGTKLKVFEAMSMGLPIVSTHVGSEGIPEGEFMAVRDEPEAFAEAAANLLEKVAEADAIGLKARVFAKQYDWGVIADRFEQDLLEILMAVSKNRGRNVAL